MSLEYADIIAKELNDIVEAEETINELKLKWFVYNKEFKIKMLEFYLDKKKVLKDDMESYFRKLKYGR